METRIGAVIDALLVIWEPVDARVVDGPALSAEDTDVVCVGYDNDPEGTGQSAASAQEWASVGQRRRNEALTVPCSALYRSRDETVRDARVGALALLDQCGQLLRADPSLGLASPCIAGLMPGELFIHTEQSGLWGRITFSVNVNTRV